MPTKHRNIMPYLKLTNITSIVSKNLLTIRESQNRTQTDVAADAEISQSYLGRIEHGKVNISIETLGNLATALRVDSQQLLEWPDTFRPGKEIPLIYREYYARLPRSQQQRFCQMLETIIAFYEGVKL